MAAYCGRMMAGRYYEGPRRDGNGGDSSYRCH
jgi:hypothetical protein